MKNWLALKILYSLPVLQRDNDSSSKNDFFVIMKNYLHFFFFKFVFQPKFLEFSPLSFTVHILLFLCIWKFRILKYFEKKFEKFLKIFEIIFFEFSGKNKEDWLPRIFQIPFSLYFGLVLWRPRYMIQKTWLFSKIIFVINISIQIF